MEDKYRILLTEKLLGESFFEDSGKFYTGLYTNGDLIPMRTFDNWADFGACVEALLATDKFSDFMDWYDSKCWDEINDSNDPDYRIDADRIISKINFPQLCAEWLGQSYEWDGKEWRDTI